MVISLCFEKVLKFSCRHRVLAELLEQGTRSTLEIPVHKPASLNSIFSQSQQNLRAASGVEYDTLRSLGINPSHALQHPGFYYYIAARCTEMRRSRFLAAVESEVNLSSSFYLDDQQKLPYCQMSHKPVALSPGFTNEKKVEHLAIINEASAVQSLLYANSNGVLTALY